MKIPPSPAWIRLKERPQDVSELHTDGSGSRIKITKRDWYRTGESRDTMSPTQASLGEHKAGMTLCLLKASLPPRPSHTHTHNRLKKTRALTPGGRVPSWHLRGEKCFNPKHLERPQCRNPRLCWLCFASLSVTVVNLWRVYYFYSIRAQPDTLRAPDVNTTPKRVNGLNDGEGEVDH